MEFADVLSTRRSIRKYTDQDVTDDLVEKVIRAGMMAPSAGNQQPWHFIVVRDKEKLASIKDFHPYSGMLKNAPVSIVVCGDPDGKKWPDFWDQDCSAAMQNMWLAARDLGLGSVWVGVYPLEDRMGGMRRLFAIPDTILPFAVLPLGWPDGEFTVAERYNPALVHNGMW